MAPQNLSQVFIVNNVTMLTGSSFNLSAATANASKFGIWDVDSSAYIATDILAKKRIQFTQSTLGNVISSPIIDVNNIVRVNYNGFASDAQTNAVQTVTWSGAPTSTKAVMIRIAVRTAPTAYEYFANPTNPLLDTTGNAKVFPLIGNFAAGRMIFNVEVPAGTYTTTTLGDYIRTAIAANPTLNAIFATSGTSTLVLTARHLGVEFDLVAQYSDGSTNNFVTSIVMSRTTPTTNYIQAISDEKAQRARYGNFNRMYFPVPQVDYSQSGYAYDLLEIQYKHDWPSSTGIGRAGEINTLKVYVGSSSTPIAGGGAPDFATAFTIVPPTDKEQVVDITLQA